MTDLYATLELPRTATQPEITRAYRDLSLDYHPDRNPGDKEAEDKFKEIQNAYEILSDPERRDRYDATDDTSSAASAEARITAVIAESYAQVLQSILSDPFHPAPANFSPVAKIRDFLNRTISNLRDSRTAPSAAIKLLTGISGRFTNDELLESLTAEQLKHATSALADIDGKITLLESALERLADVGYKWEPGPKTASRGMGLMGLDLTNRPEWTKFWNEQVDKHRGT